jgi:hypothetical protein
VVAAVSVEALAAEAVAEVAAASDNACPEGDRAADKGVVVANHVSEEV